MRMNDYLNDTEQESEILPQGYFDSIEMDSIPVKFVTESYKPVLSIRNTTELNECLSHCLRFNTRSLNLKNVYCQLVIFTPFVIQQETVKNVTY